MFCTFLIFIGFFFYFSHEFYQKGTIGDSTSVKARVTHLQIVAATTVRVLVTSPNDSAVQSSSKRNVASLVAKKLIQPSREDCLDVLYQFLQHTTSSLCVVGLVAELCVISRDFSLNLVRQSKWIASLTEYLTSCNGKDSDSEVTCCILRVLCTMVTNVEEIPAE